MARTGNFKYVTHKAVAEAHRAGWMIVGDLGRYHGYFAVLMWRCDCFDGE